jgi:hypothetical protein
MPQDMESLVLFLLEQGSKPDAVKLYQEETGTHRGDAKRAVERLARRHGLTLSDTRIADLATMVLMLVSLLLGFAWR